MKLHQKPSRPTVSENNLIPMINVVFLLLIFFMVAGIVRVSDPLPLKAPESIVDNPVIAQSVLYVASDGMLMLDDAPVVMASLETALANLKARVANSETPSNNTSHDFSEEALRQPQGEPLLAIKADARTTVSMLRDIMSAVRSAGLSRVELITSWVPVGNR